jgi:hypothetical protein
MELRSTSSGFLPQFGHGRAFQNPPRSLRASGQSTLRSMICSPLPCAQHRTLHQLNRYDVPVESRNARMAKLADARDLKSRVLNRTYRFNSGSGHQSFVQAGTNVEKTTRPRFEATGVGRLGATQVRTALPRKGRNRNSNSARLMLISRISGAIRLGSSREFVASEARFASWSH